MPFSNKDYIKGEYINMINCYINLLLYYKNPTFIPGRECGNKIVRIIYNTPFVLGR